MLFIRKIPDIDVANQMLFNLQDASSDPIDYVKALHEFMRQFLISLIRVNNLPFSGSTFPDILENIHRTGEEKRDLLELILLNEYAERGNRKQVKVSSKDQTFDCMQKIIAINLRQQGVEIPDSLLKLIETSKGAMRDKVFISYSHSDKVWFDILQDHLKPLVTYKELNVWSDEKIETGQKWKAEIDNALATAKVAVLLVTRKFLASDFIASEELPEILRGADEAGLTIIWIAVSASNFKHSPINDYQCVNDPANPLNKLDEGEREAVFVNICDEIYKAMQK